MELKNIVFFALGLIVGWNFLPQPQFVKDIVEKIINTIRKLIN
jgi:hypothetical protein